jgi:ABC-2 type transport system ATP-binding protein
MSIQAINLSKVFGRQTAVDNITFSAGKGEIVGLLGPNGAGKSTTMKIIAGYLPPSAGSVRVMGTDVVLNSMQTRRQIGYLPEHNPLYLDMYVHEYLRFVGSLHVTNAKFLKNRVIEMIALCGLRREQNKQIRALSKGYRQRVGLAQALLHDPAILVLDEPTTGLDPNQIIEIRELIKMVSEEKTVIFSTHIMQEVQAVCGRVLIMNEGRIVADDKPRNLQKSAQDRMVISLQFKEKIDPKLIENIEGVLAVSRQGGKLLAETAGNDDVRASIFKFAAENGYTLLAMNRESSTMEDVFRQLTQDQ